MYTGANGSLEIYEDDGRSNNDLKGQFSRIPVSYDEASGILSIGARNGEFSGMAKDRKIRLCWISNATKDAANVDAVPSATLDYSGVSVRVKRAN